MEGLPFVMIVMVSSIMYKNFGLSNAHITYYTGWLMLPWTIKPVWAWFIEIFKTKRWWIYAMELTFAIALILVAFSLHTSLYLPLSLIAFAVCAFASSSHDIAVDGFYLINLTSGQQSFFVGMLSAFYQSAKIFGSGVLVILSGIFLAHTNHNIALSWSAVMLIAAITAFAIGVYHFYVLPKTESEAHKSCSKAIHEIKLVFISLFKLEQIWITILFALTFRLGETMLAKIVPLFILDSRTNGGLGFDNTYVGLSNICNLSAIIVAGILGGICISRFGLKRCLWPMLLVVNIPHLIFVYLAYSMPTNQTTVLVLQALEHFTANLSLTGYMMVLFYLVRDSQYKTSHYAFIAAIMMLTNMLPSMASGTVQELLGYRHYFVFIVMVMVPSMLVIPFIKIDSKFGIK
jgi:PAT family beta-lactamase induction signal transducer AmpG